MYDKVDVGSMWGRCRVDVWSMWSWMENTYNKMRRRRKNYKIVEERIKIEEGNVVKKRQLAFVDYFNRIFNLICLQLF